MFEKFLHQTPFFRLVIPLIAGIIFQINFPIIHSVIVYILISFVAFVFTFPILKLTRNYILNNVWGVLISLVLFFAGMQLASFKQQKELSFNNTENSFIATLIKEPEEKENTIKATLKVDFIKDSINWKSSSVRVLCYFQKDSTSLNLKLGDQILAKAYLNEIKHSGNPHTFNYKKYLKYQEIYSQCYIKSNQFKIIDHNKGSKLRILSNKTRQKLLNIYKINNISGDEFAVLSALTLGFKNELTPELKESFSTSGAMHILAVSGLHVGIIFIILCKLLFFLQKNKYGKILSSLIIITVLFFYAFLTGLSDSVFRATTMFTFISIGQMFNRQINIYNSISASAFLLLIINPYSIMNVGFQLSYAAVISIVFFQPRIYSLLNFNKTIPDYLWQLISVAIAAQLGTFPITIHYFNQFPLYFILSNIIIIPLATIIIYGAILLFIFSFSDGIALYISKALYFITLLLNKNVNFIESLPYSKLDRILIDSNEVFILIIMIFLVSFFIMTKQLKFFKLTIFVLLILLVYNIALSYSKLNNPNITVHNISGITAINYIEGKKAHFISNTELDFEDKNISYNVIPLWKYYDIDKLDINYIPLNKSLNYFTICNKRILHIGSESITNYISEQKLSVDYVILSNNINIKITDLNSYIEFKKIIFDSSNSFYKIKSWEKECNENKILFYNVIDKGAFIEYL
ncbi:ComEC/Rec2 family competence protein [Bacteroidota bacterium]